MTPLIKPFHCRHCTVVKSHPGTCLPSFLGAGLWQLLVSVPTHLSLTGTLISHPKLDQKKKKFLQKDTLWTETLRAVHARVFPSGPGRSLKFQPVSGAPC